MDTSDTTPDKLTAVVNFPIVGNGYTGEEDQPGLFDRNRFGESLARIAYGPVTSSGSAPIAVTYIPAIHGINPIIRTANITSYQTHNSSLTAVARDTVNQMPDGNVKRQSLNILDQLDSLLKRVDTYDWPNIRAFDMGDGSFVLEWIARHWRIGFSIETSEEESVWYLVSDKQTGGIQAYGNLHHVDIGWLANWVYRQVKPVPVYA